MEGVNFVFHLVSAMVLIGLSFAVLRYQGRYIFLKRVFRQGARKQPGWIPSDLKRLAEAIECNFELIGHASPKPALMTLCPLLEEHLRLRVVGIVVDMQPLQPQVRVMFQKRPLNHNETKRILSHSLACEVDVLVKEGSP